MNIVGTETALSLLYDNIQQANLNKAIANDVNLLSNTLFLNDDYMLTLSNSNSNDILINYSKFDDRTFTQYIATHLSNKILATNINIVNNSSQLSILPYGIVDLGGIHTLKPITIPKCYNDYSYNNIEKLYPYSCSYVSTDTFFAPLNLKYVDKYAFCYSAIQTVVLSSCYKINANAFSNNSISAIVFSNNLQKIENQAFVGCTNLHIANLQNTQLQYISQFAFAHCSSLVSASFPSTLLSIDSFAFYDCPKLSAFNFTNANPIKLQEQIFYSCARNYTIFVSDDKYDEWIRLNNQLLFDESNLSSHIKVL